MQQPQRESDAKIAARCILSALRWSEQPLTRDELTDRVQGHTAMNLGLNWKRSTAARRVRDALALLLEGDSPVISAGHGYKLAAVASAEERERAAQLAERAGARLLAKARKIRGARLPGDARQCDFGFEAVV